MRLVHIQRLLKLTTKRSNENLIDFVFHDEIRKPPALGSLNTISVGVKITQIRGDFENDFERTDLFPLFLASLCCVTLDGETDAATLAC
jgi:hypothetical protein